MTTEKKTAAEIYQVKPEYRRFNQKFNMTRRPFWDPAWHGAGEACSHNLKKLMSAGHDGYHIADWAFNRGALANREATGFSVNAPNQKANSWLPLSATLHPSDQSSRRAELAPEQATAMVRKMARLFGTDDVGTCQLDRKWVYSHWFDEATKKEYPVRFSDEPGFEAFTTPAQLEDRTQVIPAAMRHVVVLIYEMDKKGIAAAPSLIQMSTTRLAYSRISFTTLSLAQFIRGLGFNAIPCANDTALSIPLAIDAGLGELGRNAKLIHPRFGPGCRISKIITDLPLAGGRARPWGVTEFCDVCRKCARECPAGAIPEGDRSFQPVGDFNNSGALTWQLDHAKCFGYWTKLGTNCGICLRVCPFNKPGGALHNMARRAVRMRNSSVDRIMTLMDKRLGYGKFQGSGNFWNE